MSSVAPSSEVPIACIWNFTRSWARRRRWISVMYSLALAPWRPSARTVRSAVAISVPKATPERRRTPQERRGAVALLAALLPERVEHGGHVVEPEQLAPLDRPAR